MTRSRKRLRIAAAVLGAAIALPGTAVGSYSESMSVSMSVGTEYPYAGVPSSITLRLGQADRANPAMRADYYLPKGWGFTFAALKPAEKQSGAPAASCTDVYTTSSPPSLISAGTPSSVASAEGLGGGVGMKVQVGSSSYEYGYRNPSGSDRRNPSVAFLNWDSTAQTATLCMYLRSNDIDAGSHEFLLPFTVTKLPDSDAEFDWRVSLDFAQVYTNSYLSEEEATILTHTLTLPSQTSGNWNRNATTGEKAPEYFSRTPSVPATHEVRGVFSACAEGVDTAATSGCTNNSFVTDTLSQDLIITAPPGKDTFDFGRLTGPSTVELCGGAASCAFGLIRGADSMAFEWSRPAIVSANNTVKGYILVVAEPGNQDSRHFEYIVTQKYKVDDDNNPILDNDGKKVVNPEFDHRQVCGEDGLAPTCAVTLNFPLSNSAGGIANDVDAKYDVALVTVYANGVRTDGLCDKDASGTVRPEGASCDPSAPAAKIVAPGKSLWQVMVTSNEWPLTFVEFQDFRGNGGGAAFTGPASMLFVDFDTKQGEFVRWNPAPGAKADVFAGTSASIQGAADGGVASFGNPTLIGGARAFRFDGLVMPQGPLCPSSNGVSDACGTFTMFDSKNPGIGADGPTISGRPGLAVEIFEGTWIP